MSSRLVRLLAGVAACACAGCYGPMYGPPYGPGMTPGAPYGGYPGSYPGTYPGPINTLTPGPSYAPGGVITPGSSGGTAPANGGYLQDGANSSAPPYSPDTNGAPTRGTPLYDDPNDFQQPTESGGGSPLGFDSPRSNTVERASAIEESLDHEPARFPAADGFPAADESAAGEPLPELAPASNDTHWDFETPRPSAVGDDLDSETSLNKLPTSALPGRFRLGYDPYDYSWLRGVARFDEQQRAWSIQYSTRPEKDDRCGGIVTLNHTQHVQHLRDGDFVQVQGHIDPVLLDGEGRAIYLATRVQRLASAGDALIGQRR